MLTLEACASSGFCSWDGAARRARRHQGAFPFPSCLPFFSPSRAPVLITRAATSWCNCSEKWHVPLRFTEESSSQLSGVAVTLDCLFLTPPFSPPIEQVYSNCKREAGNLHSQATTAGGVYPPVPGRRLVLLRVGREGRREWRVGRGRRRRGRRHGYRRRRGRRWL